MSEKTRMILMVSFVAAIMVVSLVLQPDWSMIKTEIVMLILGGIGYFLGKWLKIWK